MDTRIAWKHTITIKDATLSIFCFNTAWLSQIRDKKGNLLLPTGRIDTSATASLQVTLFHHPLPWLETINSDTVRKQIFEISDLIFTGHEHVRNTVRTEIEGIGSAACHEAHAFVPDSESEEAGFCAVYIDTDQRKEIKISFLWSENGFSPY